MARALQRSVFDAEPIVSEDGSRYCATIEVHTGVIVSRRKKALFLRLLALAEMWGMFVRLIPQREVWRRDVYAVILIGKRSQLERWHRMKAVQEFIQIER